MLTSRHRSAAALLAAGLAACACGPKEEAAPVESGAGKSAAPSASPMPPAGIPKDTQLCSMPSGLQYCVLRAGSGEKPKRNDRVRVHYTGWLTDGKEFDSSRGREPAEFQIGGVIEGWNQALCEMPVGSRWKITIPPALGYGAAGAPPRIPPNATLVFDVELLGVRAAPEFCKVDPAAAKPTDSGLLCQVLDPGAGAAPTESDPFELEYSIWSDDGKLLRTSAYTSETIQGRKADMRMPVLKEAPFLLREGGSLLVEVPPDMATKPGPNARTPPGPKTIWRLKLLRVGKPRPAPEFVLPPAEKLVNGPQGLRHQVLVEGKGESPGPGDEVVVQYAGWTTDGKLFDCSHERGLPATFRLGPGRLIDGWNLGMQTMKPGGTSIFVVPPELGYGARGQGAKIPPNSTLVFRIDLIEVRK